MQTQHVQGGREAERQTAEKSQLHVAEQETKRSEQPLVHGIEEQREIQRNIELRRNSIIYTLLFCLEKKNKIKINSLDYFNWKIDLPPYILV